MVGPSSVGKVQKISAEARTREDVFEKQNTG
jgi:hypothetical protein